jgi:glucose/arabinose dehydrogenase
MLRALPALVAALLAAAPAHAASLRAERVGTFREPTYVTSPPGQPRTLAVVERQGRVRLVRRGTVLRRPLADLRKRILIEDQDESVDQRGLFSIAFAPDYRRSGRLYVDYAGKDGRLHVDEWRRGSGRLRRVLDLGEATTQHHGGQLQFGADGLLYVSTGIGDDPGTSQDPASPGGKILRLDPRQRPARPELVALGLRNPWRFSFAPGGLLLIGDVGGSRAEEVDVLQPATTPPVNFGWPLAEGRTPTPRPGLTGPAIEHLHSRGWCSLVGGYVLRGRYVYGDVCSGHVWSARLQTGTLARPRRTGLTVPYLVSFGRDGRGRLYAVSLGGAVWRLGATG